MEENEVARRFSSIAGYQLVDFMRVGLPVYVIAFDAWTISSKKTPIVDEFLLRCIEKGLARPDDLAGFLGLESVFTAKRLGALFAADYISYEASESDDANIALTSKGQEAFKTALIIQPRRQTLSVAVDGITRNIVRGRQDLLRPRDLRAFGLKEIKAFPNRAPDLDEFAALDLKGALPRAKREEAVERVLSVVKLVHRSRRFREAVMLVFRAETGDDIQVRFAVDGRPFPEMDDAFRRSDGVKDLRIPEQLAASKSENSLAIENGGASKIFVQASLAVKETREYVRPAVVKIAKLEDEVGQAQQRAEGTTTPEEISNLREAMARMEAEKRTLEEKIASVKVRFLDVHEHRPLFVRALKEAKQRLLIVSPWINDAVMTPQRLRNMETLLRSGVKIYVGYGIGGSEERRPSNEGSDAIKYLERMAKYSPNFTLRKLGDTHAKVLLVDRTYVVVGSFNWMSFEGDPKRGFREEMSVVCTIPEQVDERFDYYMNRFRQE